MLVVGAHAQVLRATLVHEFDYYCGFTERNFAMERRNRTSISSRSRVMLN